MLIHKARQGAVDLLNAIQALYTDLDTLRKKIDEGRLKDEAAELCKRLEAIHQDMKHMEQMIAFVQHDHDVQRDGQ